MALSKRERGLAFAVGAVVAVLAVDHYVLSPILDQQDRLDARREKILQEIEQTNKLMAERKRLAPRWRERLANGLKEQPGDAETQVYHALRDWSRESGFTLASMKPERPESKEALKEVQIQATGSGSMEAVAKLLWKAQAAKFPLRIIDLQLGARTDGSRDLTLQLKLSTLYLPPAGTADEKASGKKDAVASAGGAQ